LNYSSENEQPPAELFGVSKIIFHPDWTGDVNDGHDAALLKLSERVQFKDHIQPICLPTNDDLFDGELV